MPFIGPWEIVLGIVVIIIIFLYKVLRKGKQEATKVCIGCGRSIPINSKFCAECGYNFLGRSCPKCGTSNPTTNRHCSSCGEKLT